MVSGIVIVISPINFFNSSSIFFFISSYCFFKFSSFCDGVIFATCVGVTGATCGATSAAAVVFVVAFASASVGASWFDAASAGAAPGFVVSSVGPSFVSSVPGIGAADCASVAPCVDGVVADITSSSSSSSTGGGGGGLFVGIPPPLILPSITSVCPFVNILKSLNTSVISTDVICVKSTGSLLYNDKTNKNNATCFANISV